MAIIKNGEVYEIVNKKITNSKYEHAVINDLLELCSRKNIWVELIIEEE
tara:strand:+ start:132 stop:278 length:147 start_codon:yes stop_codon:yes gene_type:complete